MDMDSTLSEFHDDENELNTTHPKPCLTCRKRKVKCSKTDPCSNCERADVECVYEDPVIAGPRRDKSTAELARRVADLEALFEKLSHDSTVRSETWTGTTPIVQRSTAKPVYIAERVAKTIWDSMPSNPIDSSAVYQGRLITSANGQSSRHLMNSFWASMYDEIGDLKHMLRGEEVTDTQPSWIFSSPRNSEPPLCMSLSVSKADFLMHAFFANVNQFVRILHKPTILNRLNHLRRGILTESEDFVCQLSAIYNLAVLSLSNDDCMLTFGEPREAFLIRFRSDVERGLGQLHVTTSHKISTLQTLLLHISYLLWTGEILHASSILALAIRMAQRLGVHRDGTNFNLPPWQTELRRRLWNYTVFLDTCCMENHGLETAICKDFSDTWLPQNSDDSAWDTSDSSTVQPAPKQGFTDTTFALMQYESAAAMRIVLHNSVPIIGEERDYFNFHSQLRRETWSRIEDKYLRHLDTNDLRQSLTLEIARLSFKRMHLTQLRPLIRIINDASSLKDLEAKLLHIALDFCDSVQQVRKKYEARRLDWAIIRVFSWHALATEISTCLSQDGMSTTPESERSREKIAKVFRDCPSIDYLKGNDSLWEPLRRLHSELEMRRVADEQMLIQPWQNDPVQFDPVWSEGAWGSF